MQAARKAAMVRAGCRAVSICRPLEDRSREFRIEWEPGREHSSEAMDLDDIDALELDDAFADLVPTVTFGQPSQALTAPQKLCPPVSQRTQISPGPCRPPLGSNNQPVTSTSAPAYRCTVTSEDVDCLSVEGYSQGASQFGNKRLRLSSPQRSQPQLSQRAAVLKSVQHNSAQQRQSKPASQQLHFQSASHTRPDHAEQQRQQQASRQQQLSAAVRTGIYLPPLTHHVTASHPSALSMQGISRAIPGPAAELQLALAKLPASVAAGEKGKSAGWEELAPPDDFDLQSQKWAHALQQLEMAGCLLSWAHYGTRKDTGIQRRACLHGAGGAPTSTVEHAQSLASSGKLASVS